MNRGAISTGESSSSTANKTFATAAQAPGHNSAFIASIIAAVAAATILLTVVGFVGYQHFGNPT
jgi:Na+(H+)/acetate symporter ActP